MAWKPGQSGNPGGMPKVKREVIQLARECGPGCIKRLYEIATTDPDGDLAIKACEVLLNRGFGRPVESKQIEVTGEPQQWLSLDELAKAIEEHKSSDTPEIEETLQ
jgi:hypothetical protein